MKRIAPFLLGALFAVAAHAAVQVALTTPSRSGDEGRASGSIVRDAIARPYARSPEAGAN